jgi:hypothetical protein
MACLLLTSSLAFAQADAPPIAAAGQPSLEILSGVPASGGTLRPMEEATVTIRYSCPAGFLLDRDGIVRYAKLRGPALGAAVAELLK